VAVPRQIRHARKFRHSVHPICERATHPPRAVSMFGFRSSGMCPIRSYTNSSMFQFGWCATASFSSVGAPTVAGFSWLVHQHLQVSVRLVHQVGAHTVQGQNPKCSDAKKQCWSNGEVAIAQPNCKGSSSRRVRCLKRGWLFDIVTAVVQTDDIIHLGPHTQEGHAIKLKRCGQNRQQ
jgi:hypothetical protein